MERRRALAVVLAVGAVVATAMVLFPALSPLSGPPSVTTAESPSLDPSLSDPFAGQKRAPSVVLHVGDGEDGLPVRVWNDGKSARTVSITLRHNGSDSTIVRRTETLSPNGTLRVEILAQGRYLLTVTDESTGTTGTYAVTPDRFDCNEHLATVRVNDTAVSSRTMQTGMGCGGVFAL
jgi:hypothetical protein